MHTSHKILVIGYLPGTNGIATSALNLYRNLDRDRFQYDFLLSEKYRNDPTPDLKEIASLGADFYYADYDRYHFPESCHHYLRKLLLSIPNIQGVHVHDLNMMSYPLHLADELGLPIKVIQCHTARSKSALPGAEVNPGFKSRLDLIRGDQFDRLACSDVAGIFDFNDLSFEILPNGVDTDRFAFNAIHRKLLRRQLGIAEDSCVIGSVSNLNKYKNHLFALQVFQQFLKNYPNSHYIIVGAGQCGYEISRFVKENELSDHVHLTGTQHEVELFYNSMDILLHPSISEGLPNTLVEAQATGLHCLISDQITDMAKLTPLIHVLPLAEDCSGWAEELAQIFSSLPKRKSMKSEIQAAGYDIRDVANQLMQIYSSRIKKDLRNLSSGRGSDH